MVLTGGMVPINVVAGSLAIGTLRELVVSSTCNPASMLQMLNRRMHGARLDARFIAMLFAVYDAAAHRLTLSNAGGPRSGH